MTLINESPIKLFALHDFEIKQNSRFTCCSFYQAPNCWEKVGASLFSKKDAVGPEGKLPVPMPAWHAQYLQAWPALSLAQPVVAACEEATTSGGETTVQEVFLFNVLQI